MPARSDGKPIVDREPPPEAVKAAHDAMLQLSDAGPAPPESVEEPPVEQPSDHGYDHYDI